MRLGIKPKNIQAEANPGEKNSLYLKCGFAVIGNQLCICQSRI